MGKNIECLLLWFFHCYYPLNYGWVLAIHRPAHILSWCEVGRLGVLFCVLWIWYRKVKPFWPFTAAAVGVVTVMSSLRPSENHCRAWNVLSELFLSQASPAAAHYGLPDVAENRREHWACSVYSGTLGIPMLFFAFSVCSLQLAMKRAGLGFEKVGRKAGDPQTFSGFAQTLQAKQPRL